MQGTARAFVTEKLEERDERHKRMGDSRYVVEPNVKEGKGGLRDLHTLFWIGKYVNRVKSVAELVDVGLLTESELRQFQRSEENTSELQSLMRISYAVLYLKKQNNNHLKT